MARRVLDTGFASAGDVAAARVVLPAREAGPESPALFGRMVTVSPRGPGEKGRSHRPGKQAVAEHPSPERCPQILDAPTRLLNGGRSIATLALPGTVTRDRVETSVGGVRGAGSNADGWMGSRTRLEQPRIG